MLQAAATDRRAALFRRDRRRPRQDTEPAAAAAWTASALPPLCLRLIELTIEGCRQERQNSTLFLAKLNTNLGEMHHNFAISLSEGQALFDASTHHGHHIAGELRAIGEHLVSQDNDQLKEEIELRLRSITHVLVQHERLQEREQSLLNRMNAMELQISELKQRDGRLQAATERPEREAVYR
jgi:hypothetical protein